MKEIPELFQAKDFTKLKNLLETIIAKIEKADYEKQEVLLEEVIEHAQQTNQKLKKQCQIDDGIYIYPDIIAPVALLAEEISTDFKNHEKNMLDVLKFNLNNYFNHFEASADNDWYVDIESLVHVLQVLKVESKFFDVLKLLNINISIIMLPVRFNSLDIEVINYNELINKDFTIHCYYFNRATEDKREMLEILLDQFGIILKNILMRRNKGMLETFWDMFDIKGIDKTDLESNQLTMSFANMFSHYVIEKMIVAIKEKTGQTYGLIEGPRDEALVKRILEYYDNVFEELLKVEKKEEFEDKEKCPCGSGKKYKNCCKKKDIRYYKTEEKNKYTKAVPMSDELNDALMDQMAKFKQLFGRVPLDDDYISGGVLYKDLKRITKLTKRKELVDKAWLYACEKTDLIVSEVTKNVLSDKEIEVFNKYVKEYERFITQEIKDNKWNTIQAVDSINSILEYLVGKRIEDMIYVLNLFVNFYCENTKDKEPFVIHNIKEFLVFCAYKTSINLKALNSLVDEQYYDSSMAVVRILYEILISVRAYKQNDELFEEKVLSMVGLQEGTHQKIDKNTIENINTKKRYKFEIQKRQLAEKAGEDYLEIYNKYYRELSEFIHLDTTTAKDIFSYGDMFLELDECLTARFVGAIFAVQIIKELTEFKDCTKKLSRDMAYFFNVVLDEFINLLEAVISIEDKEIYKILMKTLEKYRD